MSRGYFWLKGDEFYKKGGCSERGCLIEEATDFLTGQEVFIHHSRPTTLGLMSLDTMLTLPDSRRHEAALILPDDVIQARMFGGFEQMILSWLWSVHAYEEGRFLRIVGSDRP